ncbi:MAG: phosphotransferase [Saprospiraceae bacterium]|nr:phosphotransferase [Saprospiraceae bacterium]
MSKQHITKTWDWQLLQESRTDISKRLRQIEYLSKILPSIPKTRFQLSDKKIIQTQRKIQQHLRFKKAPFNQNGLTQLAKDLDHITAAGIVHADLCPRNIIWGEGQYWIVDWEPAQIQFRFGKWSIIFTYPYIAPSEIETTTGLTTLSDKVAFITSLYIAFQKKRLSPKLQKYWERLAQQRSFEELLTTYLHSSPLLP